MANKIKLAGTTSNTFQIGSNGVTLDSNNASSPYTLKLPPNAGDIDQILQTDGNGTLSWVDVSGSGSMYSDTIVATAAQTLFVLTFKPSGNPMFTINGVTIPSTAVTTANKSATYIPANNDGYIINAGDIVVISYLYGVSANVQTLDELADVSIVLPVNSQPLVYDSATANWVNGNISFIANGTSNVVVAASGNVTVGSAGNAGILTVTGTGANVTGTLAITGNASAGNLAVTGNANAGNLAVTGNTSSGNLAVTGNANVGNLGTTGIIATGVSNLGPVGNVIITGGSNGQVLRTDGNGVLSWGTNDTQQITNGNSNVVVAANSNVTVSVAGNANIVTVTGTGANITGTANITGETALGNNLSVAGLANITGNLNVTGNVVVSGTSNLGAVANVRIANGSNGQYLQTDGNGNLAWSTINSDRISNGNSNVVVAANSNVTVSVAGNSNIVTVTGTGANVAGTLTVTGNVTGDNFIGNGIINGNSNIQIVPNSNVTVSVGGNANILTITDTGANLVGSLSVGDYITSPNFVGSGHNHGNSNVVVEYDSNVTISSRGVYAVLTVSNIAVYIEGNVFANGDIKASNFIGLRHINGNSNITVNPNGNIIMSSAGNANVVTVTGTGANVSGILRVTDSLLVGGVSNLGAVANVRIANGANGQYLQTDGAGNLSWSTINSDRISNGNSNVVVSANSNITISSNGVANVVTVTSTGANVAGTLDVTGNVTTGNLTTGNITANNANLGNLAKATTVETDLIRNGNSNIGITANGNISMGVNGNASVVQISGSLMTVGVNVTTTGNFSGVDLALSGAANITGNVTAGNISTVGNIAAGNANVTGNITAGNITTAGNLTSGNANLGALAIATTVQTGAVQNGNTNIALEANGNVTMGISGNANVVHISNSLMNVQANITSSGNISAVGTTLSGAAIVAGNITTNANINANTLSSANSDLYLKADGANKTVFLQPTGTGKVDAGNAIVGNVAAPVASTDATNKEYVDALAQGLRPKAPVAAATVLDLGGTYNNGASGVGATLTFDSAIAEIDGYNINNGNRILIKNQGDPAQNGIYVVTSGTVFTRSTDFDVIGEMSSGASVFVENGTVNNDCTFVLISTVVTVGTSPIDFVLLARAGEYTAGTGLTLTGTQFRVTATGVTAAAYGNGDRIATFTVDATGRLTAANSVVSAANAANLTGTNLANTVVNSSLQTLGNLTGLTVTGNASFTGANVSLGNVANLKIIGGANGQYLQTDGTGNLTWKTLSSDRISNGTSNVVVAANANVTVSSNGVANIIQVSGDSNVAVIRTNSADGEIGDGFIVFSDVTGLVEGQPIVSANVLPANTTIASINEVLKIITLSDDLIGNAPVGTQFSIIGSSSVVKIANDFIVDGVSNLGPVGNVVITGGSSGQILRTDGSGNLTWVDASSATGLNNGNSNVAIAANGNVTVSAAGNANVLTITGTGANIAGTLRVSGVSNLGPVGNVTITGGNTGQVLSTDGNGVLSWANAGNATALINGSSNVVIAPNGNITMATNYVPNVVTVSAELGLLRTLQTALPAETGDTVITLSPGLYANFEYFRPGREIYSTTTQANTIITNVVDNKVTLSKSLTATTPIGTIFTVQENFAQIKLGANAGDLTLVEGLGIRNQDVWGYVLTANNQGFTGDPLTDYSVAWKKLDSIASDPYVFNQLTGSYVKTYSNGFSNANSSAIRMVVDGRSIIESEIIDDPDLGGISQLDIYADRTVFFGADYIKIDGGANNQLLASGENGILKWVNSAPATSVINGNSNIIVAANANITMSSNGVANIVRISAQANGSFTKDGSAGSGSNVIIFGPDNLDKLRVGQTIQSAGILPANTTITGFSGSDAITVSNNTIAAAPPNTVFTIIGNLSVFNVRDELAVSSITDVYRIGNGNSNILFFANGSDYNDSSTIKLNTRGLPNAVVVDNFATTINTGEFLVNSALTRFPNVSTIQFSDGGANNELLASNGSGGLKWVVGPSTVVNGNSNVTVTANGNVTTYIAGNANARFTVTSTGANITGTLNVTSNTSLTNVSITGITNVTGNTSFTGANVSLGNVSNLRIIGGSNGQVLRTDGNGVLSWANSGGSSISNGNSNVVIDANSNVRMSSNSVANIVQISAAPGSNVAYVVAVNMDPAGDLETVVLENVKYLKVGQAVTSDAFSPGTTIAGINGTTITLNQAALYDLFAGDQINAVLDTSNTIVTGELSINTGGFINLQSPTNLYIGGGNSGDVLSTTGNGSLRWGGASKLSNGSSNVSIVENSTVSVSAGNITNIFSVEPNWEANPGNNTVDITGPALFAGESSLIFDNYIPIVMQPNVVISAPGLQPNTKVFKVTVTANNRANILINFAPSVNIPANTVYTFGPISNISTTMLNGIVTLPPLANISLFNPDPSAYDYNADRGKSITYGGAWSNGGAKLKWGFPSALETTENTARIALSGNVITISTSNNNTAEIATTAHVYRTSIRGSNTNTNANAGTRLVSLANWYLANNVTTPNSNPFVLTTGTPLVSNGNYVLVDYSPNSILRTDKLWSNGVTYLGNVANVLIDWGGNAIVGGGYLKKDDVTGRLSWSLVSGGSQLSSATPPPAVAPVPPFLPGETPAGGRVFANVFTNFNTGDANIGDWGDVNAKFSVTTQKIYSNGAANSSSENEVFSTGYYNGFGLDIGSPLYYAVIGAALETNPNAFPLGAYNESAFQIRTRYVTFSTKVDGFGEGKIAKIDDKGNLYFDFVSNLYISSVNNIQLGDGSGGDAAERGNLRFTIGGVANIISINANSDVRGQTTIAGNILKLNSNIVEINSSDFRISSGGVGQVLVKVSNTGTVGFQDIPQQSNIASSGATTFSRVDTFANGLITLSAGNTGGIGKAELRLGPPNSAATANFVTIKGGLILDSGGNGSNLGQLSGITFTDVAAFNYGQQIGVNQYGTLGIVGGNVTAQSPISSTFPISNASSGSNTNLGTADFFNVSTSSNIYNTGSGVFEFTSVDGGGTKVNLNGVYNISISIAWQWGTNQTFSSGSTTRRYIVLGATTTPVGVANTTVLGTTSFEIPYSGGTFKEGQLQLNSTVYLPANTVVGAYILNNTGANGNLSYGGGSSVRWIRIAKVG